MPATAFKDVNEKVTFCFASPNELPARHSRNGRLSVLYLLRRELIETAGYDPNTDTEETVDARGIKNRLFVSLIAMFTAFDLLAKFQLGDKNGVGKRFVDFLTSPTGAGMDKSNADLFYAVRNSLVHSFGVPDVDALAKLGLQGVELRRRVATKDGGLLVVQRKSWSTPPHTVAELYIDGVFRTLHTAIVNYRAALFYVDTQRRFAPMFDKYGTIGMS